MINSKKIKGKNITFTNIYGLNVFPPKPAVKEIPKWYIDTPEYLEGESRKITNSGFTPHTIKKCIPVFDALTAGYILYTQVDVQVEFKDGMSFYTWPDQNAIDLHPKGQASLYPAENNGPFAKWMNPYAIKTPIGYSVLLVQPFNRESIFTILSGIVDTDTYKAPVNFPFVLNDVKWEGIIPAGTPMAQVIPFKREPWKQIMGSKEDFIEQEKILRQLKTFFFNSYKKQFWSRKEYK